MVPGGQPDPPQILAGDQSGAPPSPPTIQINSVGTRTRRTAANLPAATTRTTTPADAAAAAATVATPGAAVATAAAATVACASVARTRQRRDETISTTTGDATATTTATTTTGGRGATVTATTTGAAATTAATRTTTTGTTTGARRGAPAPPPRATPGGRTEAAPALAHIQIVATEEVATIAATDGEAEAREGAKVERAPGQPLSTQDVPALATLPGGYEAAIWVLGKP